MKKEIRAGFYTALVLLGLALFMILVRLYPGAVVIVVGSIGILVAGIGLTMGLYWSILNHIKKDEENQN